MKVLFFWLFFSLGLLPLIAGIDLRHLNSAFLDWIFGGIYTDIVSHMFSDVIGFLLEVYKAQMIFPIIEFAFGAGLRLIDRIKDQHKLWPNNLMKTRATTIEKFIDLYSGEEF